VILKLNYYYYNNNNIEFSKTVNNLKETITLITSINWFYLNCSLLGDPMNHNVVFEFESWIWVWKIHCFFAKEVHRVERKGLNIKWTSKTHATLSASLKSEDIRLHAGRASLLALWGWECFIQNVELAVE